MASNESNMPSNRLSNISETNYPRILIACHCQKIHRHLTSENVNYIDTGLECQESQEREKNKNQFTDWSAIPNETYDIIRSLGCPIYGFVKSQFNFNKDNRPFNISAAEILEDTWRVLKYGGYFLLPIQKTYLADIPFQFERAKQFIQKYYRNKWLVSLIDINTMPPHLDEEKYKYAIAFQKIQARNESTAKTRKNRKSRKLSRKRK